MHNLVVPQLLYDFNCVGDCTCELEVHVVALAAVRHEAQLPADALPPADHDRLLQHAAQLEPVQDDAVPCSEWFAIWQGSLAFVRFATRDNEHQLVADAMLRRITSAWWAVLAPC
jgi:hypothetical protein